MDILYIAPFATSAFRLRHGDRAPGGMGGERKVSLIAEALMRQGHHVVILSSIMLSNSRLAWRTTFRESLACGKRATVIYPSAVMLRPLGGLLNCVRAPHLIRQLVKEFKPSVGLIYNTYLFESLAAKELVKRHKIPIVLEIEDLPLARRRGWFNIKPWLDQRCWNSMLERASAFTSVNSAILDLLPDNKRRDLLPGVIDERLEALGRSRGAPFLGAHKTLGYFGGLTPQKGVKVLINLVPRLPAEWHLTIAGSGPLASEFESLSKRFPDRLTFLGRVSETQLYTAMCACDCTVIPLEQICEGGNGVFPFKVFEFLVARTHVIAPRLPALANLDLSFVQRWDGISAESLLAKLEAAEIDYEHDKLPRDKAVSFILSQYSITRVSEWLSMMLSQIAKNNMSKPEVLPGHRA
jgi:glycosyltransferase involved in cell wall biosynthesis